ncbi:MAG: hypothetical protein ABSF35_23970 [Polyangia bacterium]|jgi:plasmid maintenance system antidote protein VapI
MKASDLTEDEQKNVLAALEFLRIRFGKMKMLAKALHFKLNSLRGVLSRHDSVSASMMMRVARLAGVGLDDLLAGKYPVVGMCPHCGCLPPSVKSKTAQ